MISALCFNSKICWKDVASWIKDAFVACANRKDPDHRANSHSLILAFVILDTLANTSVSVGQRRLCSLIWTSLSAYSPKANLMFRVARAKRLIFRFLGWM